MHIERIACPLQTACGQVIVANLPNRHTCLPLGNACYWGPTGRQINVATVLPPRLQRSRHLGARYAGIGTVHPDWHVLHWTNSLGIVADQVRLAIVVAWEVVGYSVWREGSGIIGEVCEIVPATQDWLQTSVTQGPCIFDHSALTRTYFWLTTKMQCTF
jgi:hypothetical protein